MKRTKKECPKCKRRISLSNYNKHVCQVSKSSISVKDEWITETGKYKCPYCEKEYSKNGIATHIWRNHGDGVEHNPNKNRKAWNRGLTKENDERIAQYGETYRQKLNSGELIPPFLGKFHSAESKKKMSKVRSIYNKGGRCKWYDYQKLNGETIKLQGTWEVRFAKVLDKIDENWIKVGVGNKSHSFIWVGNDGQEHYYTPDFWSPKLEKYFEVKGYWWGNDKEKMQEVIKQNPNVEFIIIRKRELELYENMIL